MILGHYAVALAAKRVAPRTSLGMLCAAATFLDLLWPVFLLLGVETVVIEPGSTVFTPLTFTSYPWSHSLLTSAVWGLVLGSGYYAISGYGAGAIAVTLLVPSHWVLDYIVHRPDLPLTPWTAGRYGLSLWDWVTGTIVVQLTMFAAGVALYYSITRGRDRAGTWGSYLFIAVCLMIYGGVAFGPPPPSVDAIAFTDLGQWLLVAMAAWVDRHRTPKR